MADFIMPSEAKQESVNTLNSKTTTYVSSDYAQVSSGATARIDITKPDGYSRGVFIGIFGQSNWETVELVCVYCPDRNYPYAVKVKNVAEGAQQICARCLWFKE